ncbi:hypothetical protein ACIO3O_40155 [Streptomyces sp. NPDC087440]|uniref:hypothetical protein n=1 Tax=Streptomyces sp. NPDC087440 TaxID=3365790 RepID=UPI00380F4269
MHSDSHTPLKTARARSVRTKGAALVLAAAGALCLLPAGTAATAAPADADAKRCHGDTIPFYQLYKPGRGTYRYTTDKKVVRKETEAGYTDMGPIACVFPRTAGIGAGSVRNAVYELYKESTRDYVYVTAALDKAKLGQRGYVTQGKVAYVATGPRASEHRTKLLRVWNPRRQRHALAASVEAKEVFNRRGYDTIAKVGYVWPLDKPDTADTHPVNTTTP